MYSNKQPEQPGINNSKTRLSCNQWYMSDVLPGSWTFQFPNKILHYQYGRRMRS